MEPSCITFHPVQGYLKFPGIPVDAGMLHIIVHVSRWINSCQASIKEWPAETALSLIGRMSRLMGYGQNSGYGGHDPKLRRYVYCQFCPWLSN